MLMPCWVKKVGSQFTKPKIRVLITISTTEPTTSRGSSSALNNAPNGSTGTGGRTAGGGSGAPPDTSASIVCISASASASRPLVSSQRGLSGRFFRRYQTISAPTPAITNIGRQPQVGTTKVLMIEVAG